MKTPSPKFLENIAWTVSATESFQFMEKWKIQRKFCTNPDFRKIFFNKLLAHADR